MWIRTLLLLIVLVALPASAPGEHAFQPGALTGGQQGAPPLQLSPPPGSPLGTMTLKKVDWLNGFRMLSLRFQAQITPKVRVTQYKSGRGAFHANKLSGSGAVGGQVPNGPFDVFCMDLRDTLGPTGMLYDIKPLGESPNGGPMPPAKQELLRELFGRYRGLIDVGTAAERRTRTEAFSLAIWEIGYETSAKLDVTSGPGFWVAQNKYLGTPVVSSIANSWLASLNGKGPKWNVWSLAPLSPPKGKNTYQDLIFGFPVPEPGTLALLSTLVATLAAGAAWRRLRTAAAG
jgi:hypothetical protein